MKQEPAMTDEMRENLEWAKEYASLGYYVIPLYGVNEDGSCACGRTCTDIGKHPVTPRGLKDGSRDFAQLEQWIVKDVEKEVDPKKRRRNVGIVTGEISQCTALDIDTGQGKFGLDNWLALIREHGEPNTLKAITGSGGIHVLFQYNSALKTASNVLGKHIDCRNDRGYIVAPPSKHKSGGVYKWMNWGTPLTPLPAHVSQRKETRGRPRKDDTYRRRYTLDEVRSMLERIPADSRDDWRNFGLVLGREYNRSPEAWEVYVEWANKWQGKKARNHDETMRECFYELSQQAADRELTLGSVVRAALENGWVPKKGDVPIGQFVYYGPGNTFIYRPTRTQWIASAVDVVCSPVNEDGKLVRASAYIQKHSHATSLTCDPALEEDFVKGWDCRDGERIECPGAALFNTYRKPTIELGDATQAGKFLFHCQKLFNKSGDCDRFLDFMAHRVQCPWEKPRFALLIAGGQGVGKDTAIDFCCPAIGAWNVAPIDPGALDTAYNAYAAATLIRISETSNLHEMSKWALNERTKVLIAGNPDHTTINPKYGVQYTVKMYCGVVLTTNNLASGIYIPPDDRRYDVIDCATFVEMGLEDETERRTYFEDLYEWFYKGGDRHIAAFLHARDLSGFSPNSQRKTAAHRDVAQANLASDYWLLDILDTYSIANGAGHTWPPWVRTDWILSRLTSEGAKASDYQLKLAPTLGRHGYVRYRNPVAKDGRWYSSANRRSYTVFVRTGEKPPTEDEIITLECFTQALNTIWAVAPPVPSVVGRAD
jgi:putative DNA primase/helicase